MPVTIDFDQSFRALTGNDPFPWQGRIYRRFVAGEFPSACNLPTGLGKTSILAIWLIALGANPKSVARRLVYVVNRRTVVDQATDELGKIRDRLAKAPELLACLNSLNCGTADSPVAISSLRGQFADNGEWRDDPARPAIIVGTVDMIGSRLLFAGYRCGFKSRPVHAGLLGHDSLVVHDEAHLEPAFQELLESIRNQQHNRRRSLRLIELTATSRGDGNTFDLHPADYADKIVKQRLFARKGIVFHQVADERSTADTVIERALSYKDSQQAILIFLRKLDDVEKVVKSLRKKSLLVQQLTGTLRGHERDALASEDGKFARFLRASDRSDAATAAEGTVYLVCTSAGEVGVNISADHLVCDLTPLDSMAQRFGRVNRFGDGDALIEIVHPFRIDTETEYHDRRRKTLDLMRRLPPRPDGRLDACPRELGELPAGARRDAFTPKPRVLPVDDVLFDAWALTTVRDKLPGRPPVADWLHGVTDRDLPETHVAWREEVELTKGELLDEHPPEDLLEDYPLKPHELLGDRTDRVLGHLERLHGSHADDPVWLVQAGGAVEVTTLRKVVGGRRKEGVQKLNGVTVLLPPTTGGLQDGLLTGDAVYDQSHRDMYDIADKWLDEDGNQRRVRLWADDGPPSGMRPVRTIRFDALNEEAETDDDGPPRVWRWYVRPQSADDDAGSWSAHAEQILSRHLDSAERFAGRIADALDIEEPARTAVVLAARFHDLGKDRRLWQTGIGNDKYPQKVLAKSGNSRRPLNRYYRHELGSLIDVAGEPSFSKQPADTQDLILHLIAAHHGRGRPHVPSMESFDPEHAEGVASETAREIPRRFARLQRTYGRWGLAWLEALVRAADVLASQSTAEAHP